VLLRSWHALLDRLDEQGLLDRDEVFVYACFSLAKKRTTESVKRREEKVESGWCWRIVIEFHSHSGPKSLRLPMLRCPKKSSTKSPLAEYPLAEAPTPRVTDRGCDSLKLRTDLLATAWDLVCSHRLGRVRSKIQDRCKLMRYRRRVKSECTIAWIRSYRRPIIRHEYYRFIYQGFIHLACMMICL
jgi:hypothetical protein